MGQMSAVVRFSGEGWISPGKHMSSGRGQSAVPHKSLQGTVAFSFHHCRKLTDRCRSGAPRIEYVFAVAQWRLDRDMTSEMVGLVGARRARSTSSDARSAGFVFDSR